MRWARSPTAMNICACRCGSQACLAAAPAKSKVVVQVIADHAAVVAAQNLIAAQDREQQQKLAEKATTETPQHNADGESADSQIDRGEPGPAVDDRQSADAEPAEPAAQCQQDAGVALLPGRGFCRSRHWLKRFVAGRRSKPLWLPGADPEPQYRPSAQAGGLRPGPGHVLPVPGL